MSSMDILGDRTREDALCATVKGFDLEYNVEPDTWEEGYPKVGHCEETSMGGLDFSWRIGSGLTAWFFEYSEPSRTRFCGLKASGGRERALSSPKSP